MGVRPADAGLMRLLVFGGRYYRDDGRLWRMLDRIHLRHGVEVEIDGRCPYGGADLIGQRWAEHHGITSLGFEMVGRAGPQRNTRMIREGMPTHAIGVAGGRGTADMLGKAIAALGEANVYILK